MIDSSQVYRTIQDVSDNGIKYFFISKGNKDIIKVIQYSYVADLKQFNGVQLFNLGFGDYNLENDQITDDTNTNNGDAYCVLNTVLSTIPKFFQTFGDVMMIVRGSDSRGDFIKWCRENCRKNCNGGQCKNYNKRIKVYRNFVDKNFNELTKEYNFYGGLKDDANKTVIEVYKPGKEYDSVLVSKNSIFEI